MSVHYKFKSSKDFDTVTFDGLHISIGELKKNIIQQKKIGKGADYELQITNAQTKEVYDNDEILVPKNTSVLVSRIPIVGANKKNWHRETSDADALLDAEVAASSADSHGAADSLKVADIAASSASEEDKIKAMISQSSTEFDSSKFVKKPFVGPPPASYVCFKCLKPGHWIQKCPHPPADKSTMRIEVKRSTGIPRSFMKTVDDPTHKGVMFSTNGELVIPVLDAQAYQEKKIEKPPFVPDLDAKPAVEEKAPIPEDLQCMICKDLLTDAVLIPCCGTCFCDECIRFALLDSDHHECPVCHELDQTPDKLIPNRFLRTKVSRLRGNLLKKKEDHFGATTPAAPTAAAAAPVGAGETKPFVKEDTSQSSEPEAEAKPAVKSETPSKDPAVAASEPNDDLASSLSPDDKSQKAASPEQFDKENADKFRDREKVEVLGGERDFRERDDRWPPRWRPGDSRDTRETRPFDRDRRRYERSPPRYRRPYREFSPPRRGMPRPPDIPGTENGPYQPLNPPPMPFPQFAMPPSGYPAQPPSQQPPPPGLGAPMMPSFPVSFPPMGMMHAMPMPIPSEQAQREALEEFEKKLSEMRHGRRRRSPSPMRRRRYSRSRSRSFSPRGAPPRRRSRSNSRGRMRGSPTRRRSKSRSPYGRYARTPSRERDRGDRFRGAGSPEYTRPLQLNSRRKTVSNTSKRTICKSGLRYKDLSFEPKTFGSYLRLFSPGRSPPRRRSTERNFDSPSKRYRERSRDRSVSPRGVRRRSKSIGRQRQKSGTPVPQEVKRSSSSKRKSSPIEALPADKKKKKRKNKSAEEDEDKEREGGKKKKKKEKRKKSKDVQEADTTQPEKEDREGSVPVVAKIEDSIEEGKIQDETEESTLPNSPDEGTISARGKSTDRSPFVDHDSASHSKGSPELHRNQKAASPERPPVEKSKWERSSSSERESSPVAPLTTKTELKSRITSEVILKAETAIASKPPRIQPPPSSSGVSSKIISLKPIKSRLGEQLKEKDVFKHHHQQPHESQHHQAQNQQDAHHRETSPQTQHSQQQKSHHEKGERESQSTPKTDSNIQITIHNDKPKRKPIRPPSPSPTRDGKKSERKKIEEKDDRRNMEREKQQQTTADRGGSRLRKEPSSRDDARRRDEPNRNDRRKSPTREKDRGGTMHSSSSRTRSRSRERDRRERSRSFERRERDRLKEREEQLRKERRRREELERELQRKRKLEEEIERERRKREQLERELQQSRREKARDSREAPRPAENRDKKRRYRSPSPTHSDRERSSKRSRTPRKETEERRPTNNTMGDNLKTDEKVLEELQTAAPVKTSSSLAGHDLDLSFEPDYDLDLEPERKSSPVLIERSDVMTSKKNDRDDSSDSSSSSSDDDSDGEDRNRRRKHRKHKKNKHKKAKKSKKIKS